MLVTNNLTFLQPEECALQVLSIIQCQDSDLLRLSAQNPGTPTISGEALLFNSARHHDSWRIKHPMNKNNSETFSTTHFHNVSHLDMVHRCCENKNQ